MSRIDEEVTPIILPDGSTINRRIRRGMQRDYILLNGRSKFVYLICGKYFVVDNMPWELTDSKFYVII